MFTSKKNKNDVVGSTQRFVDVRRDATSRYKHFRFVIESTPDALERKLFIEQYSFEAFHLFHELLCQVDLFSSHSSAPRNITELEFALWVLEILLCYLPEFVAQRWEFNAIYNTLKKISHPHNTLGLRRIATRLFVIWYQILGVGSRGADDLDIFFASLVPNLVRDTNGPPSDQTLLELCEQINHRKPSTNVNVGDISSIGVSSQQTFMSKKCSPLAPAVAEKGSNSVVVSKGLLTQTYMEKLLDAVSVESVKIEWKTNKNERTKQCLRFLLDKIKHYYGTLMVSRTNTHIEFIDIANPKIPTDNNHIRQHNAMNLPADEDPAVICAQCLARWAAAYSFSHRKQNDSLNHADQSFNRIIQQSPSRVPDAKLPHNFELIREIFFGSKSSVNFILTLLRQGFLLPLTYAGTMGRVFKVLREWLTSADDDDDDDDCLPSIFKDSKTSLSTSTNVGVQKSLQTFVAVLASFFNNPYLMDEKERVPLILQISSRILTLFKYLANNNNFGGGGGGPQSRKLTLESWTFILKVLLQIVRNCLPRTTPVGGDYPLAHRLAPQLYQTVLVTWVFSGLNVALPSDMWEELLTTMSERNTWSALINEWAKVLESVTRALGSQLYNVDLSNLPLERISEQKYKKIRGKLGETNEVRVNFCLEESF